MLVAWWMVPGGVVVDLVLSLPAGLPISLGVCAALWVVQETWAWWTWGNAAKVWMAALVVFWMVEAVRDQGPTLRSTRAAEHV